MAVTTSLAACNQNEALNGPDGATDLPSQYDNAIRYALSFIARLRDGVGFTVSFLVSGAAAAVGALTVTGKAVTVPVSVAYSATPTFDAATSNVFYLGALTGNVSSFTISNPTDGQSINIRMVQDGTGNRTVTVPASVKAGGYIETGASRSSWLILTYVASATRWEGAWSPVPA